MNCTVTFTPDADVTSGHLEVFGIFNIGGTKVRPFPLPPDRADACHNHVQRRLPFERRNEKRIEDVLVGETAKSENLSELHDELT